MLREVHELSICQALLVQVAEVATARGATAVERIFIEIGPLSGAEPMQVASAFAILRAGSCAADAELFIASTAVEVTCRECGAKTQTMPNKLICGTCGGYRTRIVTGDELRLLRVELRAPQANQRGAH